MKNLLLFSSLLFLLSCSDYYEDTYIQIAEDLPSFDFIESSSSETVILHESNQGHYIEIIIPEVFADNLDYWVESNTLFLDRAGKLRGEIEIHVFTPYIAGIYNEGSGRIYSSSYVPNGDYLEVYNEGSGRIDIDILNDNTKVYGRGSGRIDIDGRTTDLDVLLEGSGDYRGHGLDARSARVEVTGSGSAYVRCYNYLRAYIFGSGNIYVRGNPSIDLFDEGSGELLR